MTIKLFYNNPYITEFTTEVTQIKVIDKKYHLVLKETAFYPEGGGQPCDLGEIDGINVEYVYEEDNVVYHVLNENVSREVIFCTVDFRRRFDHMQQHSGEHLLSSILLKLYNGKNVGFHLGTDYVTLDISIPNFSKEMAKIVEAYANEIIYKNIPIKCYIVERDDLSKIPIRKETAISEDIRIVEISKVDYSACCGTHVNTTGEIGLIKIIKTEKYKGNTRIYFKCGERALKDYSNKHDTITGLMKLLSSDEGNILNSVENLNNAVKENSKTIRELKERIYKIETDMLMEEFHGEIYKNVFSDKSFEEIDCIGKLISDKSLIVLLCTTMENRILFLVPKMSPINCGELFKNYIKEFNGKGGGSNNRAQGSFSTTEELLRFYNFVENYISNIKKV